MSYRARLVTRGFSFINRDNGCPMPPAAPRIATLELYLWSVATREVPAAVSPVCSRPRKLGAEPGQTSALRKTSCAVSESLVRRKDGSGEVDGNGEENSGCDTMIEGCVCCTTLRAPNRECRGLRDQSYGDARDLGTLTPSGPGHYEYLSAQCDQWLMLDDPSRSPVIVRAGRLRDRSMR